MNNRFKFRAWDTYWRKWKDLGELSYSEMFQDDKYIVQQYTGLKDINGVDIYEGDILSGTHYEDWEDIKGFESVRVVKWVDRVSGFRTFHVKDIEQNSNGLSIEIYDSKYIILGNLLENYT